MSDYTGWIVGGLTPVCILNDPVINPQNRTITINCLARTDLMDGSDPRVEIQRFQDISCRKINNIEVNNGGTNLQVTSGDPIIVVTDGTIIWQRCALQPPEIKYDQYHKEGLVFTLVIEYEEVVGGGFVVYEPNYGDTAKYPNLEYYMFTDKTNPQPPNIAVGNELGYLKIVEEQPVKKVIVYGTACVLPAWVNVEGASEGNRDWVYGHEGREETVWAGSGVQALEFNLPTPTEEIIITTSTHLDQLSDSVNHGAWVMWIKLEYAG